MKKRILLLSSTLFLTACACVYAFTSMSAKNENALPNMLVEVIAQAEGADWQDNSTMGTKKIEIESGYWVWNSEKGGYYVPARTASLKCCVSSSRSNKCDTSQQDGRC